LVISYTNNTLAIEYFSIDVDDLDFLVEKSSNCDYKSVICI